MTKTNLIITENFPRFSVIQAYESQIVNCMRELAWNAWREAETRREYLGEDESRKEFELWLSEELI